MYVQAQVLENGEVIDTFLGDYPSLEGLDVGTIISSKRINSEITMCEYEILSREIVPNHDTTQIDPNQRQDMIRIKLRRR